MNNTFLGHLFVGKESRYNVYSDLLSNSQVLNTDLNEVKKRNSMDIISKKNVKFGGYNGL